MFEIPMLHPSNKQAETNKKYIQKFCFFLLSQKSPEAKFIKDEKTLPWHKAGKSYPLIFSQPKFINHLPTQMKSIHDVGHIP